tara:strand:- start:22705 stop:22866 length:162 start_codon:yes stop_codon:yes gene_type:complete
MIATLLKDDPVTFSQDRTHNVPLGAKISHLSTYYSVVVVYFGYCHHCTWVLFV